MSRLVRAYGDAPDQNYTVARMLWAVRKTPGFSNLQPYVVFFAPRGKFARAMWAHDARGVRVRQLVARHRSDGTIDAAGAVAATNRGDRKASRAGAACWRSWPEKRAYSASAHLSSTVRAFAERTPHDQVYLHPELQAWQPDIDEATLLFRETAPPAGSSERGDR